MSEKKNFGEKRSFGGNGDSRGFWLVNSDGEETELYQKTSDLLWAGETYVRDFAKENGRVPTMDEYKSFLLNHEILAGRG